MSGSQSDPLLLAVAQKVMHAVVEGLQRQTSFRIAFTTMSSSQQLGPRDENLVSPARRRCLASWFAGAVARRGAMFDGLLVVLSTWLGFSVASVAVGDSDARRVLLRGEPWEGPGLGLSWSRPRFARIATRSETSASASFGRGRMEKDSSISNSSPSGCWARPSSTETEEEVTRGRRPAGTGLASYLPSFSDAIWTE